MMTIAIYTRLVTRITVGPTLSPGASSLYSLNESIPLFDAPPADPPAPRGFAGPFLVDAARAAAAAALGLVAVDIGVFLFVLERSEGSGFGWGGGVSGVSSGRQTPPPQPKPLP
eukprot:CAMPEP_0174896576 /NCGR_PEP_ID=MMETSP0167-20121228/10727_1 /TAXON_ID=38298 /ORGANISM="Rhodella maculata, Strain CCMP736" /LENGTH=113 /DNA_ID=CAMNT_0016136171 /DNA_START=280 /DNA_END=618 /DNA_ORIENTATION=+